MTDDFGRLHEVVRALSVEPDETIGVAVSGGSDSLGLLLLLHENGWAVEAATVDHGLRPEAADEARRVARICAERGIAHEVLTLGLSDGSGNLQDRARRGRFAALRGWARARGLGYVALGHTADDQAETFLMRIARGSGLDGLSGMAGRSEEDSLAWLRPLLTIRRAELRDYLRHLGVDWMDDPSNEDRQFERVRMRDALVLLEPLGVTPEKIGEATRNLSDVRREIDARARDAFLAAGEEQSGDLVFRFPGFREAAGGTEVLRRSFAAALRWVSGADYAPRSEPLLELISALRKGETRTLHGCLVSSGKEARIARELNAVKELVCATDELWDGRWLLDGPHDTGLEVRALGEAVNDTDWRETGLPRASLMASPSVWRGETLVSAPLAGRSNGWTAKATGRGNFADFLIRR